MDKVDKNVDKFPQLLITNCVECKNCVKSIFKNQYISKKIDILKNYEKDIIDIDKNTCNGDNCADREIERRKGDWQ